MIGEKLSLSTEKNKKHNTSSTKGKYIRDSTFSPKSLTHTIPSKKHPNPPYPYFKKLFSNKDHPSKSFPMIKNNSAFINPAKEEETIIKIE